MKTRTDSNESELGFMLRGVEERQLDSYGPEDEDEEELDRLIGDATYLTLSRIGSKGLIRIPSKERMNEAIRAVHMLHTHSVLPTAMDQKKKGSNDSLESEEELISNLVLDE